MARRLAAGAIGGDHHAMPGAFCYAFPRPSVTVDVVAFGLADGALRVLLIRRKDPPFAGSLALPGGFLEMEETPEAGARRELREETGVELDGPLEPLGFYGEPGRDPRGRTISLVFASVCRDLPPARGADDADEAGWIAVGRASPLAFDHGTIVRDGLAWLREGVMEGPLGTALIRPGMTTEDLRVLFRDLGLAEKEGRAWLGRQVRRGALVLEPGRPRRVRPAE